VGHKETIKSGSSGPHTVMYLSGACQRPFCVGEMSSNANSTVCTQGRSSAVDPMGITAPFNDEATISSLAISPAAFLCWIVFFCSASWVFDFLLLGLSTARGRTFDRIPCSTLVFAFVTVHLIKSNTLRHHRGRGPKRARPRVVPKAARDNVHPSSRSLGAVGWHLDVAQDR